MKSEIPKSRNGEKNEEIGGQMVSRYTIKSWDRPGLAAVTWNAETEGAQANLSRDMSRLSYLIAGHPKRK